MHFLLESTRCALTNKRGEREILGVGVVGRRCAAGARVEAVGGGGELLAQEVLLVPLVGPVEHNGVVLEAAESLGLYEVAQALLEILRHKRVAEALRLVLGHVRAQRVLARLGQLAVLDVVAGDHVGAHEQTLARLELRHKAERVRVRDGDVGRPAVISVLLGLGELLLQRLFGCRLRLLFLLLLLLLLLLLFGRRDFLALE